MYKSGRVSIVKTTKYKIFLKFLLLTATLPASLRTDPVTEKNKKKPQTVNLHTNCLICLCMSDRGVLIELRLFHSQLKTPCSSFKDYFVVTQVKLKLILV